MSEQQPTVGRIVHYYAGHWIDHGFSAPYKSNYPPHQPLAAIITATELSLEDLEAFKRANNEANTRVVRLDVRYPGVADPWPTYGPLYPYSETPKPGHWTWPPRA